VTAERRAADDGSRMASGPLFFVLTGTYVRAYVESLNSWRSERKQTRDSEENEDIILTGTLTRSIFCDWALHAHAPSVTSNVAG
jgi:hypothetical protein